MSGQHCRIKTGLGRILLDGAATLSLKSGKGDISVEHATESTELKTGSGDVHLREVDGRAVVKNANGAIWVGEARGDLELKAANGRVRLGEVVRGSVMIASASGDLDVGVREGTAAWLDVRTATGQVHNQLDAADGPEPSVETVEVGARTARGDILIRRP